MKRIDTNLIRNISLYLILDIICVGIGMGVPIFCILLGFPLGWGIVNEFIGSEKTLKEASRQILKWSFLASFFTFLQMLVIWGRIIPEFFNSSFDYKNFGHPFILYDPKISLIGWLILMIIISPFLQLLATIFTSFIFLAKEEKE